MLAILVALFVLTACSPSAAPRAESPPPKAPFASEEQALAAAVAVFDRLTSMSDEIARSGGTGVEQLEEVATGEFLSATVAAFSKYPERGVHQTGYTSFRDARLQQFSSGPLAAVSMYVCNDFGEVDIVDRNGASVVAADRPDTLFLLVTYDIGIDGNLRVSDWERWDERSC